MKGYTVVFHEKSAKMYCNIFTKKTKGYTVVFHKKSVLRPRMYCSITPSSFMRNRFSTTDRRVGVRG
jgi:hypothetical protein